MYSSIYSPGAIVTVLMGGYQHYAIVSDRYTNGMPMLISLSARRGTVHEEPWHTCAKNRQVTLSPEQGNLMPHVAIARARSAIRRREWHFLKYNCEHFAREVHGLGITSKQVRNGLLALSAMSYLFLASN